MQISKLIELILFLVGNLLVFISFMSGKKTNNIINSKIERFWLGFKNNDSKQVIIVSAGIASDGIKFVYGKHTLFRSYVISLVTFFLLLGVFLGIDGVDALNEMDNNDGEVWLIFFVFISPFNALIDYASVMVTKGLLSHLSNSKTTSGIVLFIALDLLIAFAFYLLPINFSVLLETLFDDPNQGFIKTTNTLVKILTLFFSGELNDPMQSFSLTVSFSGLLPSLIFIVFSVCSLFLIAVHKFLPKPIDLVLQRLREADSNYLIALGVFFILISDIAGKMNIK